MALQDLLYALTQTAHNFGAVAVTAGAIFARWPARQSHVIERRLAWLVLAALFAGAAPFVTGVSPPLEWRAPQPMPPLGWLLWRGVS